MELPEDDRKIQMNTLSQVMNRMREKGYEHDFQMSDIGLVCKKTNEVFKPEDVAINGVYRFEGESDPGDMSILYTMESYSGTKGLLLDAFGPSSENSLEFSDFIKKVKRNDKRP